MLTLHAPKRLKVGLYYSLIDWHHKDFPHYGDRQHPMRNHAEYSNENRNFDIYLDYMHTQVKELCSNYGRIDILWFDFSYDDMRAEKWRASRLVDMVRTLQPGIILNNRLECSGEVLRLACAGQACGISRRLCKPRKDCAAIRPVRSWKRRPVYWEVCATMNRNWGYCDTDNYYMSAEMLQKSLLSA